ncbi:hypothetical protein DFH28DRAFT_969747 [Melampsora americana]|nr:hypothetical protein DFH28DRAFT_969747 [Melampsora americana]
MDTSGIPQTGDTFQSNDHGYIDQASKLYEPLVPMDTSPALSHHTSRDPLQEGIQIHQRIYKINHEDGLNLDQHSFFGQESQSGISPSQMEPPSFGRAGNQERIFGHTHKHEATFPSIAIKHAVNAKHWDHDLDSYTDDILSTIPLSIHEYELLGWAPPTLDVPQNDVLQKHQFHGQEELARTPDKNDCTYDRRESADPKRTGEGDNMEAFDTVQESPKHQEKLSEGSKRLSIRHEDYDGITNTNDLIVDNSKRIENPKKKTSSRNKQTNKPKVKQSQGLMGKYIREVLPPISMTQTFDISTKTEKNQHAGFIAESSRTILEDVTIPTNTKKPRVKDDMTPFETTVTMLKDIGEFYVSNSPMFAYAIPIWFKTLRDDMMKISGQEETLGRGVHKVIQSAHQWCTPSFFGLISIHNSPGLDESSMERILEHVWKLLKAIFDQWRYMEVKDMTLQIPAGVAKPNDWLEPRFLFGYFSKLHRFQDMSLQILKSILMRCQDVQNTLNINFDDIGALRKRVKSLYNKDMMFIQGGLYSRASIGNLEFDEMKSFSGHRKFPWTRKYSDRHKINACRSLSKAAKFLSPVGLELCQKIHKFFVELIIDLLNKYKFSNELGQYSRQQIHLHQTGVLEDRENHESNMETIVKAMSIAEYRITVGFMGMIRSLYEKCSTEPQMTSILDSGLEYLQKEFSKWKLLNFERGTNSIFDIHLKTSIQETKKKGLLLDPRRSFKTLCMQTKDPSNTPILLKYLRMLLRSWFDTASDPYIQEALGFNFREKMRKSYSCLDLLEDI